MNQLSAQVSIDVKVAVSALNKLGEALGNIEKQFSVAGSTNTAAKGFENIGNSAKKAKSDVDEMAAAAARLGGGTTDQRIAKLNASIKRLQAEAQKAGKETDRFNKILTAIGNRQREIATLERLGNTMGGKVAKSSGRATQSLINFNRVVQDAPYGIIGVANNIDPLIESFGRLKTSAGGIGGAFKALGSALIGPAGILLAVSAITSGLTVIAQKYGSLGKAIDVWTGKTKLLTEEQKKLREENTKLVESIEKQKIEIGQLVKVARGDIGSKAEQKAALDKLNKAIPDYIGKLTEANINTAEGVKIINTYTAALEKQAIAELLVGRLAELGAKRFDNRNEFIAKRAQLTERIANAQRKIVDPSKISAQQRASESFATSQQKATQNLQDLQDELASLDQAYAQSTKNIINQQQRLRDEIDKNTTILDTSLDDKEGSDSDKFKKYLDDLIKKYELTARSTPTKVELQAEIILLPSGIEIDTGRVKRMSEGLSNQINTALATNARPLVYKPKTIIKPDYDIRQMERMTADLNNIIKDIVANGITTIAESLGEALATGENPLKAVFRGIIQFIGDGMIQIGKALVQFGVVKANLDKVIKAGIALPGAVAIAAGAAAIALGALVKNAMPQFANGGIVTGPTVGMIGEGGQPEVILPLSKINQFLDGGGNGVGRLEAVVSGDSLRFILERNQRKQSRLL